MRHSRLRAHSSGPTMREVGALRTLGLRVLLACLLACSDSSGGDAGAGGTGAGEGSSGNSGGAATPAAGQSSAGSDADANAGMGAGMDAAAGSSAGSAGSAGQAGGASGAAAGAGAGGVAAPRSERAACVAYVTAVCKRNVDCGLSTEDCTSQYAAWCPDWTFAEGSDRSIEQVFECADVWKDYPCVELREGVRPCRLPGTRTAGESCITPAQCESLVCGSTLQSGVVTCNTCARIAEPGEACGGDGVACPFMDPLGLTDPPPLGMGQECEYPAQCAAGLACRVTDPDDDAHCLPLGKVGEGCERYGVGCEEGLVCLFDGSSQRCRVAPGPGEPCAQTAERLDPTFCGVGTARCDASGMCRAQPSAGEPCYSENGSSIHTCDLDSACLYESREDIGMCVPTAELGEACNCRTLTASSECPGAELRTEPFCESGLRCACDGCEPSTCQAPRLEGESCSEPFTICEPNTECRAGVCVGLESLGLFEQECMQ